MKTEILESVEKSSLKTDIPYFEVGDTVDVHCRIVEGDRTRTQVFSGTVIAREGRGINESFTVRRIVADEGVERKFPIHSPKIAAIKPVRSAKTKRAKLYFLRSRTGKGVRLAQRRTGHTSGK